MQEIYGKLEEPDGLEGLVRLRAGGARLPDQILQAEKTGSWSEALVLYEQVMESLSWSFLYSRTARARGLVLSIAVFARNAKREA